MQSRGARGVLPLYPSLTSLGGRRTLHLSGVVSPVLALGRRPTARVVPEVPVSEVPKDREERGEEELGDEEAEEEE